MAEGSPTSFQASFKLACEIDSSRPLQMGHLTIIPAAYVLPSEVTDETGTGLHYMQTGVKFYQAWMLTADLELATTLWACESTGEQKAIHNSIVAPTNKSLYQAPTSAEKLHDDFVVSDASDDDFLMEMGTAEISNAHQAPISSDLHLRINMRPIFERIFLKPTLEAHESLNMESTLGQASVQVQNGKQVGCIPLSTCLELSNMVSPAGDLDEAAKIFTEFIDYIHEENRDDSPLKLHLSKLLSDSGIEMFDEEALQTYPDLLKIYDQLIDIWVTNLPHKTPGTVRLKKARQIQSISMELCLSSLGISLRNEAIEPTVVQHTEISLDRAAKDMDEVSRASSPPFFSSQFHTQGTEDHQFSLPTPERTPSIYSHTSAATTDVVGDPTLSRLRQYAVSIASETELAPAKSTIISQWPSVPGVDPVTYSWEEMQKAAAAAASADEDNSSRREQSRRRRRTEKFLKSDRASEAPSLSQPMHLPFGSQPIAQNIYSSQPFNEVPMTQPDRGAFGGRPTSAVTPGKKKPKKRRAAGF
jgi:RNA polymerase I-specific transcription initiation factor RRN6